MKARQLEVTYQAKEHEVIRKKSSTRFPHPSLDAKGWVLCYCWLCMAFLFLPSFWGKSCRSTRDERCSLFHSCDSQESRISSYALSIITADKCPNVVSILGIMHNQVLWPGFSFEADMRSDKTRTNLEINQKFKFCDWFLRVLYVSCRNLRKPSIPSVMFTFIFLKIWFESATASQPLLRRTKHVFSNCYICNMVS